MCIAQYVLKPLQPLSIFAKPLIENSFYFKDFSITSCPVQPIDLVRSPKANLGSENFVNYSSSLKILL